MKTTKDISKRVEYRIDPIRSAYKADIYVHEVDKCTDRLIATDVHLDDANTIAQAVNEYDTLKADHIKLSKLVADLNKERMALLEAAKKALEYVKKAEPIDCQLEVDLVEAIRQAEGK